MRFPHFQVMGPLPIRDETFYVHKLSDAYSINSINCDQVGAINIGRCYPHSSRPRALRQRGYRRPVPVQGSQEEPDGGIEKKCITNALVHLYKLRKRRRKELEPGRLFTVLRYSDMVLASSIIQEKSD